MRKKLLILGGTLGAVLLIGAFTFGAAFAANPTPTPTNQQNAFLAKVASILGIDQQKLQDAFTQARLQQIDDAVAAGKITQQQGEWLKQGIQQGYIGKSFGFGHRGHWGGFLGGKSKGSTTTPTPSSGS
jgi:membrane-bound lytic murein transglycosylase B